MAKANETPSAETSVSMQCDKQARLDEIHRVADHYEQHPEECCCDTYLGRGCCMAPIHGDLWRATCIENGDRFTSDLRAKSRVEAIKLGQEIASEWGGECISVRKVRDNTHNKAA